MIKRNTDGTFTVAGMVTCLSEAEANSLLEATGAFPILDPLTLKAAAGPRHTYETHRVVENWEFRGVAYKVERIKVEMVDHAAA
jgi:hypothetical protein